MARESRRKRDEQRFGKSERLADLIVATPMSDWLVPDCASGWSPSVAEECNQSIEVMQDRVSACPVIDGTGVLELYWEHPRDKWVYQDFPNVAPPFPTFFVEARRHPSVSWTSKTNLSWDVFPERWGILFIAAKGPIDLRQARGAVKDREYLMGGYIVTACNGKPMIHAKKYLAHVSDAGSIIDLWITSRDCEFNDPAGERERVLEGFASLLKPFLFVLSMLHCKNVTINSVEPDAKLNRERRKAGLKPFIRYNTINIEPMKKVLRAEGQVETNGLRRALHICRGHFATYSEDKPLFGRVAGTFWKEAHVRGSGKEGNVISDYRVNAPAM